MALLKAKVGLAEGRAPGRSSDPKPVRANRLLRLPSCTRDSTAVGGPGSPLQPPTATEKGGGGGRVHMGAELLRFRTGAEALRGRAGIAPPADDGDAG